MKSSANGIRYLIVVRKIENLGNFPTTLYFLRVIFDPVYNWRQTCTELMLFDPVSFSVFFAYSRFRSLAKGTRNVRICCACVYYDVGIRLLSFRFYGHEFFQEVTDIGQTKNKKTFRRLRQDRGSANSFVFGSCIFNERVFNVRSRFAGKNDSFWTIWKRSWTRV